MRGRSLVCKALIRSVNEKVKQLARPEKQAVKVLVAILLLLLIVAFVSGNE